MLFDLGNGLMDIRPRFGFDHASDKSYLIRRLIAKLLVQEELLTQGKVILICSEQLIKRQSEIRRRESNMLATQDRTSFFPVDHVKM